MEENNLYIGNNEGFCESQENLLISTSKNKVAPIITIHSAYLHLKDEEKLNILSRHLLWISDEIKSLKQLENGRK